MKEKQFDELLDKLSKCHKCSNLKNKNGKDCSLINIYKDKEFCRNIPSIWTNWYQRLESDIMIIGQDWGPYQDMQKLNKKYLENKTIENFKNLIESEKSLTKKMLTKYLIESSNYKIDMDKIYTTNAIMCARTGTLYRDNNIKLKESTINCSEYLKEQIKIVKPKVILTLGYYPLLSLAKTFNLEIEKNLKDTIKKYPIYKTANYIIIPLYHPTAQIKKEIQLKQYNRIWKCL